MFVCRGGAIQERNLIIVEALNNILPRRQAVIISYVNGEGRVIIIIVYPLKIYPPRITTSRGGFWSLLLMNNTKESEVLMMLR